MKLRFRTFHDDVSSVAVRLWDVDANAQSILPMTRVAKGAPCFQPSLGSDTCDYWQATVQTPQPDVYWYRFVVRDGSATAYYGDDTTALDGGAGATTSSAV